jgi:polysaccharide pyruvyl transferase WcaK-like protein
MSIAIYNTALGSHNSGDSIIMEAISNELDELFPMEHKVHFPTHYPLSLKTLKTIKQSRVAFIGGTNLLTSKFKLNARRNQWSIGAIGTIILRYHTILMGCGWKHYNEAESLLSRAFYKTILSPHYVHSVRDLYTETQLRRSGIPNVCNTACPTMWNLTPEHCDQIPQQKAERVVFTLTDYRKSPKEDAALVRTLVSSYSKVFFWLQGMHDLRYLHSLVESSLIDRIEKIGPSLGAYDDILSSEPDLDYVGTRLHAGIRALQKGKRALIIGVDNRAMEKKKDFNLPVIPRTDVDRLALHLKNRTPTSLTIPQKSIEIWRSQFRNS